MEEHIVKILATEWVTHNVRRFTSLLSFGSYTEIIRLTVTD